MEAGAIKEVGTPAELLMKEGGLFRALVDETGETNAEAIRAIAFRREQQASDLSPTPGEPTAPVSILSSPKHSSAKIGFTTEK